LTYEIIEAVMRGLKKNEIVQAILRKQIIKNIYVKIRIISINPSQSIKYSIFDCHTHII